jgi:hypothetical protein
MTLLRAAVAASSAAALFFAVSGARADVAVQSHVDVELNPAPGGLYYVGTPAVKIVNPPRITVALVQGPVVHTRVIGMQFAPSVVVGAPRRPVVYVGAHPRVRPIAYYVAEPVWVSGPGVVVVAPAPPVVVVGPGVWVGKGKWKGGGWGHGRGGWGHHGGGRRR